MEDVILQQIRQKTRCL